MKHLSALLAYNVSLLIGLLATTGCVTTKEAKDKSIGAAKVAPKISGDVVILQPFTKSPILSDKSTAYWINVRSTPTSELAKMQGLLATGEWQTATDTARAYLVKHPGNPEALMGLACGYALGRRYELAGYYANQVLKIQPQNSDAMNVIGLRVMMATGNRRADYQDAIAWFQKASEADGTQIAASLNTGHLMLELGDSQNAIGAFKIASDRCDECERSLIGMGIAASRAGQPDVATTALERAIEKNPSCAEAKYHLAMNYRNNYKDRKKAISLLQQIVSDADGRFANEGAAKRQANIALRRLKATDRTGGDMKYATQNVRPNTKGEDADVIPVADETTSDAGE